MPEKDTIEVLEENAVETYEFTDEEGQNHCFVVESRFKVGGDDYVALLEVDPTIFEEECDCGHDHARHEDCDCRNGSFEEEGEEPNIILAKVVTTENGEIDIRVPSDEEFEKARAVYEELEV